MTFRERRLPNLLDDGWDTLREWKGLLESEFGRIEGRLERVIEMPRLTAYGSHEGQTNGTSEVQVVKPPLPGITRKVVWLNVYNADTAAAVVNVAKKKTTTNRQIGEDSLAAGETYSVVPAGQPIVLDATDEQVVVFLDGAVTTNQLPFNASWEDYEK